MGYIMDLRKEVGSRPLIMVGASVILLDSEQKVLLQLRQDNDCWGLPGGSLDLGETLEEVARRELYEETGFIAVTLTLFKTFSGPEFYYKYPHGDEVYNVVTTYICKDYKGKMNPQESEVKELRFFCFDNLPHNISPPDLPVLDQFIENSLKR